jgi:hypothetical protein
MIKIEISNNKKELKIVLTDKEAFIESYGEENPYPEICDLLEDSHYLGNNYFDLTDMLGLTNSPIIGYNCSFDFDDGNNLLEGDCYWFPNYQIENPFETLLNKGSVIFLLGE